MSYPHRLEDTSTSKPTKHPEGSPESPKAKQIAANQHKTRLSDNYGEGRDADRQPALLGAALWYVERGYPVFPVHCVDDQGRCSCGKALRKLAEALGVEVADLFPKAQAPLPLEVGGRRGGGDDPGELEGERRIAEALWDPTPSDEAFHQSVEMAPTDALHARADERVRDYHTPPKREGLRSQPRDEVISRVQAFARATIVGEELKRRGEKPPERHNLALRRFEDAMSDAAPRYEEQEGQEAG